MKVTIETHNAEHLSLCSSSEDKASGARNIKSIDIEDATVQNVIDIENMPCLESLTIRNICEVDSEIVSFYACDELKKSLTHFDSNPCNMHIDEINFFEKLKSLSLDQVLTFDNEDGSMRDYLKSMTFKSSALEEAKIVVLCEETTQIDLSCNMRRLEFVDPGFGSVLRTFNLDACEAPEIRFHLPYCKTFPAFQDTRGAYSPQPVQSDGCNLEIVFRKK